MSQRPSTILIGMDASEIELIDRLVLAGRMPTVAAMRQRGRYGRLQTHPPTFLSMVWPTFYASQSLGHHGWYFNKLWRAERQRMEYIGPEWLPNRIFWEGLDDSYRVAVLDLPFATASPPRLNGVYLNGWQCHDDFGKQEYPAGFRTEIEKRHGKPKLTPEVFGEQSAATLLAQRREVLETDEQFADICVDLLKRERWDLFLAAFGAGHRGTHYLWDLSQIDTDDLDDVTRTTLQGARDDCYQSWDAALGRILAAAADDARVLVFSLHGMGPNDGWFERLQTMVEHIHRGGGSAAAPKRGLIYSVKRALPWRLVRQVTRRIPHAWNKALVPLWSRRMYDWSSTRYFAILTDHNGQIRLNVKGREAEGIVEPSEVDAVCAELRDGMLSFRDIDTGQPVVADVIRIDDALGADAPRRNALPDLVVTWVGGLSAQLSSGVVSDTYGELRWPKGAKFHSGRSGNHTDRGWFIASGPGLEPGQSSRTYDTVSLLPTAFDWMGAPQPDFFHGKPIPELTGWTTPV